MFFLYILIIWRTNRILSKTSLNPTLKTLPSLVLPIGFFLSNIYWILDTIEGHDFFPEWRTLVAITKLKIGSIGFPIIIFAALTLWKRGSQSSLHKKEDASGVSYYLFVKIIFMMLNMIQKPMGGVMLCLSFTQLQTVLEIFCLWRDSDPDTRKGDYFSKNLVYSFTICLFLLGERYFFSTGHQRALSSIQYEIGFVGLDTVNWILSPLFVLLNTYGPQILFTFATPLLIIWKRKLNVERFSWLFNGMLLLFILNASVSIIFAGHFRRHLMVWRVFAPKFLFTVIESILEILCLALTVISVQ
jgi:phosphatidylinositol glycan class O